MVDDGRSVSASRSWWETNDVKNDDGKHDGGKNDACDYCDDDYDDDVDGDDHGDGGDGEFKEQHLSLIFFIIWLYSVSF